MIGLETTRYMKSEPATRKGSFQNSSKRTSHSIRQPTVEVKVVCSRARFRSREWQPKGRAEIPPSPSSAHGDAIHPRRHPRPWLEAFDRLVDPDQDLLGGVLGLVRIAGPHERPAAHIRPQRVDQRLQCAPVAAAGGTRQTIQIIRSMTWIQAPSRRRSWVVLSVV